MIAVLTERLCINSYYFKKSRNGYDEVGRDYDNPDMVRVLASLTTAAKECSGELEVEDDFDFLYVDLIDYFD